MSEVKEQVKYIFDGPEEVEIRRVLRPGYFGITSFGKSITRIGCPISERGHKTGLTSVEEAYYENLLNLKPGELNKHSKWWDEVFNVEYALRLNNSKGNKLILDNPINQIRYKVLLASNKIANSKIETNPDSEFYIDNKELQAKAENQSFEYEFDGMERILKMTTEERRNALRLFGKDKMDSMSELMLKSELGKMLKRDPKKFVEILSDADLNTKAWIYELVEKGLLKRDKNGFKHNDTPLGSSIESAVEYFSNPVHQDVKLILTSELNKLKKKVTK